MPRIVSQLDTSTWSAEAHARAARFEAEKAALLAYKEAERGHYLYGTLDGVGGASVERSETPQAKLIARDFKNGHKEACVMLVHPKLQQTLDNAIRRDLKAPRGLGDREASREAAVRRAKQVVRHKCKAMNVNALWTLTYRENMTDRDRCLQHLDRFRRKMTEMFGEWRYVAVLEQQERGAWHVHLATHALPTRLLSNGVKVKSWDVMREVWRSITLELGGTFNEAKRKPRWGRGEKRVKGCDNIASYIAGYVAKEMMQSELNRKRYSSSKGVDVPKPYKAVWRDELPAFVELVELAFAAVGDNITRAWFDAERQIFFVASDDSNYRAFNPSSMPT